MPSATCGDAVGSGDRLRVKQVLLPVLQRGRFDALLRSMLGRA